VPTINRTCRKLFPFASIRAHSRLNSAFSAFLPLWLKAEPIAKESRRLGRSHLELSGRKGGREKLAIAIRFRSETTVPIKTVPVRAQVQQLLTIGWTNGQGRMAPPRCLWHPELSKLRNPELDKNIAPDFVIDALCFPRHRHSLVELFIQSQLSFILGDPSFWPIVSSQSSVGI